MAFRYSPKIVTDGLVFYVDAANNKSYPGSGVDWNDLSGNGYDGNLVGGPSFSSENKGSLIFDGIDDYATFNLGPTTESEFTLCFFAKRISGSIFILINRGNGNKGIWFNTNLSNITFTIGSVADYRTPHSTEEGEFYYICYAVKGAQLKLYRNGSLYTTKTISSTRNNSNSNTWNLAVSQDTSGNLTNRANEHIFSIKKYNRQLTAEEVSQNFNATRARFGL